MVEVTGDLHLWRMDDWGHGVKTYTGYVFNDTKGRFADGDLIHTSKVVKVEDSLVYTLNSVYRLVSAQVTIQLAKERNAARVERTKVS